MTTTSGVDVGRGWVLFFWTAAIFNFLVGAAGMFAPAPTIDARLLGLLVFAFGIVYAVVARDPNRFATVLWAGVFGKVGVVSLFATTDLAQTGSGLTSVILALDVLFAFGFLVFLFTRSDAVAQDLQSEAAD